MSSSKISRVSRLSSRHSSSARGWNSDDDGSGHSASNSNLKPALKSRTSSYTKRSLSFKSVRRTIGAATSFGGIKAHCKSSGTPKMKFSKLNSPELDNLSFPTSSFADSLSQSSGETNKTEAETASTASATAASPAEEPQGPAERYPIPWHTQVLVAALTAFFVARLPSLESLDEIANIDTFTHTVFEGIPLTAVIGVRLSFACIMLGNALSVFLYGDWAADTDYFPGSKLRVVKRVPFKGAFVRDGGSVMGGIRCISSFTLCCWMVEGTCFFLAGMIPLFHYVPGTTISPWMFRLAIVLWEIGASVSILVSAVVKYALWPMAMEHGENAKLLKATSALMQHNLNSVAALIEVGLLGGLPIRLSDFAFPPLFGIAYLIYTYFMMYRWTDPHDGPQFFYPFFDTTLGAASSLMLIALLAVMSVSFCIFVGAEAVLSEAEKYAVMVPMTAIAILSAMVCRVQD